MRCRRIEEILLKYLVAGANLKIILLLGRRHRQKKCFASGFGTRKGAPVFVNHEFYTKK
jgi:hypothetical protein